MFFIFCFFFFVQRVLEQRITALLDRLLVKPSLVNLPPMEEGGLLLVSSTTRAVPSLLKNVGVVLHFTCFSHVAAVS